ncbi:DUF2156 domain-containing protein [Anaerosinus massiliensis]|uniref:DUF2156 domain-containing protein n=1 Tax=Massilibacillus massiliensis TaxID=1806837 RepID=UPI000B1DB3E9|nr:phosphatidylglycerol lysyltransferase domain-containing protein [Massilibacillus massiliensis]
MIYINFQALKKEDKSIFDRFFSDRYYENSHFNFTNLFMWRNAYQIMWAIEDDVLYLKATWENEEFALQPFGPVEKMQQAIGAWLNYFKEQQRPFFMYGVEKSMVVELENFKGVEFEIEEDRDNFDYVYESQDLIHLAGRKYHSKKNHLNSFKKNYPEAEYKPITDELITQCKLNINGWYKKHGTFDDPILTTERDAIIEVLNNFEYLNLQGGAIVLDHRVVAFTFGEQLNTDTAVIHVEKADPDIRGAYSAINQEFVEAAWSHLTYINREEDMGLAGLRKAKTSYKPIKMIEKFNVRLKEL